MHGCNVWSVGTIYGGRLVKRDSSTEDIVKDDLLQRRVPLCLNNVMS